MSSRPLCHLSRQVMGRLQTFKQSRVSYMLPRTAYSTAPSACGFNDYETEKATFKIDTPSHFNFVTDVIEKWAQYGPVSFTKSYIHNLWQGGQAHLLQDQFAWITGISVPVIFLDFIRKSAIEKALSYYLQKIENYSNFE